MGCVTPPTLDNPRIDDLQRRLGWALRPTGLGRVAMHAYAHHAASDVASQPADR